jgi:hypothetical protein
VRLGRVRRVTRPGDWSGQLRQALWRYDSVALTWLEGGVEYVCFRCCVRLCASSRHTASGCSCMSAGRVKG